MKTLMLGIVSVLLLVSAQRFVQKENKVNKKVLIAASSALSIQGDKVKITKEDLPEATKKILAGDAFKGWEVTSAYKVKGVEYEVELKKENTTQTVKFDKDGKLK